MVTYERIRSERHDGAPLRQVPGTAIGRATLLALSQGVVIHGPDGRILLVNPAAERILGLTAAQMSGLTPTDAALRIIHEDGSPFPGETHPASVALATGHEVRDVVMGVHKPDGSFSWIWVNAVPVEGDPAEDEPAVVVTFADITDQVRLLDQLRASEERYRMLAENAVDVVVRSTGSIITWVSPSLQTTLGWRPDEWIGHPAREFVHADDVEQQQIDYADALTGGAGTARRRVLGSDGMYHWIETHFAPFVDAEGTIDGHISSFRLIDDTVEAEHALDRRARYDALTGLLNRAEILERLNTILAHPRRAGREIAVAFCDVDDFHVVNEAHGHGGGDEALRVLAARFETVVREEDLVARFGGDEILVVLPGVHDLDGAIGVAQKLRAQALLPIPVLGGTFPVSISIGVTLAHCDESADSLIARADDAMFAAKADGKNRVIAIGGPTATWGPSPLGAGPHGSSTQGHDG